MPIKIKFGDIETEMEQEEINKAIESGELSITPPENAVIYDKDGFESFKENFKKEAEKDQYETGKKAGYEMWTKEAREKSGVEFEGKNVDNFINAFKTKTLEEAKIEPSKQIKDLKADNEKLRNNYQEIENQFTSFKEQSENEKKEQKKNDAFLSFIPETGLKVDRDVAALVLKNKGGFEVEFDETGNTVLKKNGEIVKDEKTLNPVNPKDFLPSQIETFGLTEKQTGGRGQDDDPGKPKASDYEKFVKEMDEKGVSRNSLQFQEELNQRQSAGTLKI